MNNDLERIWKEVTVASLEAVSQQLPEETKEIHNNQS
jgi:hypothetical protein